VIKGIGFHLAERPKFLQKLQLMLKEWPIALEIGGPIWPEGIAKLRKSGTPTFAVIDLAVPRDEEVDVVVKDRNVVYEQLLSHMRPGQSPKIMFIRCHSVEKAHDVSYWARSDVIMLRPDVDAATAYTHITQCLDWQGMLYHDDKVAVLYGHDNMAPDLRGSVIRWIKECNSAINVKEFRAIPESEDLTNEENKDFIGHAAAIIAICTPDYQHELLFPQPGKRVLTPALDLVVSVVSLANTPARSRCLILVKIICERDGKEIETALPKHIIRTVGRVMDFRVANENFKRELLIALWSVGVDVPDPRT